MSHQADTASPLAGATSVQADRGATSSGHLLEFYGVGGSWQVFDHTQELGSATIAGAPAVSTAPDGALQVFAAGSDGHLLEFYGVGGSWQVFDHTQELGSATIAGAPAVSTAPDGALQVFAAGSDGHLLEFYGVGGSWQVFDHTQELGSATIIGAPAVSTAPDGALQVFAAGTDGHLLEFYGVGGSWQVFDHTQELGSATIAGAPAVSTAPDGALQVFAAGTDGHFLEFYRADGSWQVFDHTQELGSATIIGAPAVSTAPDGALQVFAAGTDGHLLEFYRADGSWQVFDHTQELGSATIIGAPAVSTAPDGALQVFAAGTDGHLLEFYRADGSWQVFDHTQELGGATIAGAPALFAAPGSGALRVFARSSPPPLVVVTGAASEITPRSARLVGTVDPRGGVTTLHFEYGVSDDYGSVISAVDGDVGPELAHVARDISGLRPGTAYHFRLVATNAGGPAYGADSAFTTLLQPVPDVSTGAADDIRDTAAVLTGTVNPEGSATRCHFQWGTTVEHGSEAPGDDLGAESTPQRVSRTVDGLEPNAVYHYRLVATNAGGMGHGDDRVFTTKPSTAPIQRLARVTIVNANSDDHALTLWKWDETEPSRSWQRIGDLAIDSRTDFIPADRHIYRLVAVDPVRCGRDDPQQHDCWRWSARVMGDPDGPVQAYIL